MDDDRAERPAEREWEARMQAERSLFARRAAGSLRRAIGTHLPGESPEELERIATEDEDAARRGLVPLRREGMVRRKHVNDLTLEDASAREEADRVTRLWLKGAQRESGSQRRGAGAQGGDLAPGITGKLDGSPEVPKAKSPSSSRFPHNFHCCL